MKNRSLYIVLSYTEPDIFFLLKYFESSKYFDKIFIINKKEDKIRVLSGKEQFQLALSTIRKSKREDIIIGWSFYTGIFLFLASLLLLRRRNIIGNNLIFHFSKTQKRNYKYYIKLYSHIISLKNKYFVATVNAKDLIDYYSKKMSISPSKFYVVNDSFDQHFNIANKYEIGEGYIFCGGKSNRDIQCFINVVKKTPNIKFVACFNERDKTEAESLGIPENLTLYSNIDSKYFYELVDKASIVCIPLKTKSPAGLYVIMRAILLRKPIISTQTFSTNEIIPNDNFGFLCKMHDVDGIVEKINLLKTDNELCKKVTDNAYNNLKRFSPANCTKAFLYIVDNYYK